jgi:hypothetical protein
MHTQKFTQRSIHSGLLRYRARMLVETEPAACMSVYVYEFACTALRIYTMGVYRFLYAYMSKDTFVDVHGYLYARFVYTNKCVCVNTYKCAWQKLSPCIRMIKLTQYRSLGQIDAIMPHTHLPSASAHVCACVAYAHDDAFTCQHIHISVHAYLHAHAAQETKSQARCHARRKCRGTKCLQARNQAAAFFFVAALQQAFWLPQAYACVYACDRWHTVSPSPGPQCRP